jgi:LAO/AO transport system kinase
VQRFQVLQASSGQFQERRRSQALTWMWERIESGLRQGFRQHPQVREALPGVQQQVASGQLVASVAASQLLRCMGMGDKASKDAP